MTAYEKLLSTNRTLIFDLDNTLYSEADYLKHVFRDICSQHCEDSFPSALSFLEETFKNQGRDNLIQKFIEKFKLGIDKEKILDSYRGCKVDDNIECYHWFKSFTKKYLGDKKKLRIITNGNVEQQKNKIKSINFPNSWQSFEVIFANDFIPKPHPLSFSKLDGNKNFIEPIYIGDSAIDKIFCSNLGIEFFDVRNAILAENNSK